MTSERALGEHMRFLARGVWRRPPPKPPDASQELLAALTDTAIQLDVLWGKLPYGEFKGKVAEMQSMILEHFEDEVQRVAVSKRWSEDWDSKEDAVYDE